MHTDEIFQLLEQLAATPKTTEKLKILQDRWCPELAGVVKAALDPTITYGIADVEGLLPPYFGAEGFNPQSAALIAHLAARTLSGNAARDAIKAHLKTLSEPSANLLLRVITKDLRCGVGDTLVKKVAPALLPTFEPMLAAKFESKRLRVPAYVQTKLDGLRAIAFIRPGGTTFYTRNGHEITSVPHLCERLQNIARSDSTIVLDGELTAGSFNESVSAIRKAGVIAAGAKYHIFDILTEAEFFGREGVSEVFEKRQEALRNLVKHEMPDSGKVEHCFGYVAAERVSTEEEVHAAYAKRREAGLEGVIVKAADGRYWNKRSPDWMKIKAEESVDLKVVGWFEGTGKYAGQIGGLWVRYKNTDVGVGSGLTDEMRAADPDTFIGRIAEILYHEETPDGSLRHPRLKCFRDHTKKGLKE